MIRISIKDKIKGYLDEIPEGVKLLAVSKTKPISDILEAYDAGIRDFGDNTTLNFNFVKNVNQNG